MSLGEQFPTFRTIVVRFIFRVNQPKKRNRLESKSRYGWQSAMESSSGWGLEQKLVKSKVLMHFLEASFLKTEWVSFFSGVAVFVIHTHIYGIYVDIKI